MTSIPCKKFTRFLLSLKRVKCGIIFTLFSLFNSPVYAKLHATSHHQMVVTAQHLATHVGTHILNQGGNAIDAAVAIGYALAVVHPCCGNIGGGGFMLIHFAQGGNAFINFRESAPLKIKPNMLLNNTLSTQQDAFRTVGVPGTVLGLNTALQRYGTLALKHVIQPAIHLAEKGYTLTFADARFLNYRKDKLAQFAPTRALFFKHQTFHKLSQKPQHNELLKAGDTFKQPQLAHTLTLIANQGSPAFYEGSITKKLVAASERHGGVLTKQDFKKYRVEIKAPLTCTYRGYTIVTAPPPSAGGITLCEVLNIDEGYPMGRYGFRAFNNVQHNLEAMRLALIDRTRYLGDPDFVSLPMQRLLSKSYAARQRERIHRHYLKPHAPIPTHGLSEGLNTTAFAVADRYGNVVVATYSLNDFFGSKVTAGDTGFLLNGQLTDFNIKNPNNPNALAPFKRPLSSIAPTLILNKRGQFYMALATPGGPTIPTQLIEIIQNVIDYRQPIREAVDQLRYHRRLHPDQVMVEQGGFGPKLMMQLTTIGYHVHIGSPYHFPYWGGAVAILRHPLIGTFEGVVDSRRPGGSAE